MHSKETIKAPTGAEGERSVEALRIEADAMERALSLQETHLDKQVATIATLEATNAAQAEQLAECKAKIAHYVEYANLCATEAIALHKRIHDCNTQLAAAALFQSIPPEPQAGVEATNAEIDAACHAVPDLYRVDAMKIIEAVKALNQRQAVKALSAAQGVPEYNWFVGKAGDEYIQSVAYKGQHTLPAQFRWNDLFNVLLKSAISAAPEQAESKEGE